MNVLLDQGLPRGATGLLAAAGWGARHVGDLGGMSWPDEAILERARADGAWVISLDADFHALLARSGAVAPSAVRIRIEGLRAEALCALLVASLTPIIDELRAGALVTIDHRGTRVKRLPIVRP